MKSYNQMKAAPKGGVEVRVEGEILRVFFDFKEVTVNDDEKKSHKEMEAESVDVVGGREYPDIVSAIVKDHYSDNDVQAILSNHAACYDQPATISDEKSKEYAEEYHAFQEWRNKAKEVAKVVLTLI